MWEIKLVETGLTILRIARDSARGVREYKCCKNESGNYSQCIPQAVKCAMLEVCPCLADH